MKCASVIFVPTVTSEVDSYPPSSEVAVMVAFPIPTAVTVPYSLTVATLELFDNQVTFLFVGLYGVKVTVNSHINPTTILNLKALDFGASCLILQI